VRLKEKGKATEVIAVSIGPQQASETIRTALAMGADRGILVKTDGEVSRWPSPRFSKPSVDAEQPAGDHRQAGDRRRQQPDRPDAGGAAGLAAGHLRHKLELGDGSAKIDREIDGGLQTVEVKLPAVMTTDLRLNEPRYASLPNIMKAKKKPIDEKSPPITASMSRPRLKVLKVTEPPKRGGGVKVAKTCRTARQAQERSGSDLMAILVIAEHDNKTSLKDATAKTVTAAAQIGGAGACAGGRRIAPPWPKPPPRSPAWRKCCWPTRAYARHGGRDDGALILSLADKYDAILAPATTNGKNYLPRVAAKLDVRRFPKS
jgi:electron transfer flavoprotein beta subunit